MFCWGGIADWSNFFLIQDSIGLYRTIQGCTELSGVLRGYRAQSWSIRWKRQWNMKWDLGSFSSRAILRDLPMQPHIISLQCAPCNKYRAVGVFSYQEHAQKLAQKRLARNPEIILKKHAAAAARFALFRLKEKRKRNHRCRAAELEPAKRSVGNLRVF